MAGIGFVLRKLSRRDDLLGIVKAYTHSALTSSGPWLFTVIGLSTIMALSGHFPGSETMIHFRIIIIYNFAFSLVFSGPIYMVCTRYLADRIYEEDVSNVPGMLIGSLFLLFAIELPIGIAFYMGYATMPLELALISLANFLIISAIWLVSVFITALKDYQTITRAFLMGVAIAVGASIWFSQAESAAAMLLGFTIGMAFILAVLIARILAEYPYPLQRPFAFLQYFRRFWELALGGLIYNMGVWVDKWVMWFAPEAERTSIGLISYPNYDSAMFLAYLTIVPSLALFIFSVETQFYEHYLRFYRNIQKGVNFNVIQRNHRAIVNVILSSSRNFLILQGTICVLAILAAPRLFAALDINFLQMSMFRFGVLGSLFHSLTLFIMILLSYFDNRKATLWVQGIFLISSFAFTYIGMEMGFSYYGYGYFLAALLSFVVAAVMIIRYVMQLPYHTFITHNASVQLTS